MRKVLLILMGLFLFVASCDYPVSPPESSSGVKKVNARVITQASGLTVEQENVRNRLLMENKPGSIKHLYVISAMSGQVIIYSTVKGKVTSSSKRLTPTSVVGGVGDVVSSDEAFKISIGNNRMYTSEVLQDDGTYGSSIPYLYWIDVQGRYHQHYVSGGQILHISDQPIPVKNIIINMEHKGSEGK